MGGGKSSPWAELDTVPVDIKQEERGQGHVCGDLGSAGSGLATWLPTGTIMELENGNMFCE